MSGFRLRTRLVQNVAIALVVAVASVIVWPSQRFIGQPIDFFRNLELAGYDTLFALRGMSPGDIDPRIVVVGYDTSTEKEIGAWPPDRKVHAQVIRNIKDAGAQLIVYDVLFSGPSNPESDRELDRALKEAGNVVLTCRIDRNTHNQGVHRESPYYDDQLGIDFESHALSGFAEVAQGEDRVIRTAVPVQKHQDEWVPSLATAAYLRLTGKEQESISATSGRLQIGDRSFVMNGPTGYDPASGSDIPSYYVNFSGGMVFPLDCSFSQAYDEKNQHFRERFFRDKIVFVGLTGVDLTKAIGERYVTSFTSKRLDAAGLIRDNSIPGVVVQAHLLNSLLRSGAILMIPAEGVGLIVFLFCLLALTLTRRYANWRGPFLLASVIACYLLISLTLFGRFDTHLPWVMPMMLMAGSSGFVAWLERGFLRRRWAGYVSPGVLQHILKDEDDVSAQRYEATVLFGDIRGFTSFSDQHSPEKVIRLLNQHFERLTRAIYAENGTIDKFMGDGILAVFGAPVALEHSALRAVRAAFAMRQASLEPIIDEGESYVFATGFGITTGPFVAGHVGSKQRHDFTIIGDVVNVAARLQGVTGQPDIVIDAETYIQVQRYVEVESLGEVQLKGKPLPVACYKVTSVGELKPRPHNTR